MTPTATVVRRPIRLPFRILAEVFCLAAAFGLGGAAWMAWRGVRPVTVLDVVLVPGMLWLLRLVLYAAWSGRVPTEHPYWPFASARLQGAYFLLFLVFNVFGR